MKRKRKLKTWVENTLLVIALLAVTVTIVTAQGNKEADYQYTDEGMWVVASGDTLWDIASEYSDERHDIRQVIHIIRTECNDNISADIYPGQTIYVPLFDCMDWEYWEE